MSNLPPPSRQTEKKRDIRELIQSDSVKAQIALVLPKHLTADRMARVTLTACIKTPKLLECSPESLLQALMLCSQAGLEPDGRNAHLIPYGNVVTVIFDWKGLVALARRNGVENIAADIVCENDTFEFFRNASGLQFKHEINYRKARGPMFCAFCIWKDGDQFDGEVMTKEEIDGIRKRSKAGNSGPWVTDYNEMAKKTVVRRASKKWPLDAEIAEAAMIEVGEVPPAKPQFSAVGAAALGAAALFPEVPQIAAPESPAAEAMADEVPMAGDTPKKAQAATHATEASDQETPRAYVTRLMDESGIPFDGFVATVSSKNIAKNADTWASMEDVPEAVFEIIAAQGTTLAGMLRTYKTK